MCENTEDLILLCVKYNLQDAKLPEDKWIRWQQIGDLTMMKSRSKPVGEAEAED